MILSPRNWANAIFLWLSLATVVVPAVGSYGSPLQRQSGSAFSAFTSDVSLGPSRPPPPQKNSQQQSPTGGAGDPVGHADAVLATSALALIARQMPDVASFGRVTSLAPRHFATTAFRARAPPLP